MQPTIQLKVDSLRHVPIDKYKEDFTFIVNGEEHRTSRLVADLLSRKISRMHAEDATIDRISIITRSKGDFVQFLRLASFETEGVRSDEADFLREVAEELDTECLEVKSQRGEVTVENVIDRLSEDERYAAFYGSDISADIEFAAANLSHLIRDKKAKMKGLSAPTIEAILRSKSLQVESEDELLQFVNFLCCEDDSFVILYSEVYFENVGSESIKEFLEVFNIESMTTGTWQSISKRLMQQVILRDDERRERKNQQMKNVEYKNDHYNGIIEYFRQKGSLKEEVNITASSVYQADLQKVLQKDFPKNNFATNNVPGSWICIEFKKHQVIPTYYTIRSNTAGSNNIHPRSWVLEGSSDSSTWEQIDEQKENSSLNGPNQIFTFQVQNTNQHKFKYLRIRQTGINWENSHHLYLNYIEIFGKIY